jgi:glutamyl-Q tRNA(Asp) synthetase
MDYVGRFAPSPTGPLHAGSLRTAVASYLDAKAHQGIWLIRIEDLDTPRNIAGADHDIIAALATCGMHADGDIIWQSQHQHFYQTAFKQLQAFIYPCACSRKEIADSQTQIGSDGAVIYPGTCRDGIAMNKASRSWRLRVPNTTDPHNKISFTDRWQGLQEELLATDTGDFVVKRADDTWTYQLAVVVDDALQGVTHVVRGADLLHSTARQIYIQSLLHAPTPSYLHVPVVTNVLGEKLSKQTGAEKLDLIQPIEILLTAARGLGLTLDEQRVNSVESFWQQAIPAWAVRFL